MKRKWIWLSLGACVLVVAVLGFFGKIPVVNDLAADLQGYDRAVVQQWGGKSYKMFVNDDAVRTQGTLPAGAAAIMAETETYAMRFAMAYNGYGGSLAGNAITPLALVRELDARIQVLQAQGEADWTPQGMMTLTYEQLAVDQQRAAKVIVSYAPRRTRTQWREGYIFQRDPDSRVWELANVIVDTGHGGAAALDALAASEDPAEWLADYSYPSFKRSDYEKMSDFTSSLTADGQVDEMALRIADAET